MSNEKKGNDTIENKKEETLYEVTELLDKVGTPKAVFIGTATMQGWKPGKQITESEYSKAVACFNNAPAGRIDHA
ncbi:MAG: hypothetical protein RR131_09155 [Anaerovorax sp.]